MNRRVAAVVIVLIVIAIGVWLFLANGDRQSAAPSPAATIQPVSASATPKPAAANTAATIRYTSNGFSPATLTVAVGTTVTISNDSGDAMSFNSNPHPTHTNNPFLNLGEIAPGQSATVTIPKAGTFGYHDHLNPSMTGTIVAQ